jgi:hypothetical protein
MPSTGWHGAENHPIHGVYRWTGPESVSFLDLPLVSDEERTIGVLIISAITPEVLQSFRLEVNGSSIDLESRPGEAHSAVYRGTIPQQILEKSFPVRLMFRVDQTFSPASLNIGDDTRQLGLAVASIQVN